MRETLHHVVDKLVKKSASGTLNIKNSRGHKGKIALNSGRIMAITVQGLTGKNAAQELNSGRIMVISEQGLTGKNAVQELLGWVSISTSFVPSSPDTETSARGADPKGIVAALKRADTRIKEIRKAIPEGETVFRIGDKSLFRLLSKDNGNMFSEQSSTIDVALALDGDKSVLKLVDELDMSELEFLWHLYLLQSQGFLQTSHAEVGDANDFLQSFEERVGELVGPVADVVMQDASERLGSQRAFKTQKAISDLVNAVCEQLDSKDAVELKKWVIDYQS